MSAAALHGAKDLRIEPVGDLALEPDEVRLKIAYGGICGSDLSYYFKGRVGDFAVRHPMILGHEGSGEIQELGSAVQGLAVGTRVALDPSRPCLSCEYRRAGRSNLCRKMKFLGSAAVIPHVQGGFAQSLVVRADQCIPVPDSISLRALECAEPLAVAMHGVRRAGDLLGKRVLVTGSGPVGLLCVRIARLAGAREVCDLLAFIGPRIAGKWLWLKGPGFNHSHLVTQAAISGAGVALGRGALVWDALRRGQLIRPFRVSVPSRYAYFVVCSRGTARNPVIATFRDWLISEGVASQQEIDSMDPSTLVKAEPC